MIQIREYAIFLIFLGRVLAQTSTPKDLCKCELNKNTSIGGVICGPMPNSGVSHCRLDTDRLRRLQSGQMRLELNNISNMSDHLMSQLNSASIVEIRHSAIKKMMCSHNYGYEQLDLSHNEIRALDESTRSCQSSKMKRMRLAHNRIESIVRDYFVNMGALGELDLSFNAFRTLDLEFHFVVAYMAPTLINLANNMQLTRVDAQCNAGPRADRLRLVINVGDTGLDRFPPVRINQNVANFAYFARLNNNFGFQFYYNKANDFVGRIETDWNNNAERLQFNENTLNVDIFNNLISLPNGLEFNFDHTGFKSIPNLNKITNLKGLEMPSNYLESLNNEKNLPETIRRMDFRSNQISHIVSTFFLRFANLEEIRLDSNRLKAFDNLEFSSNQLKYLWLANNEIETVNNLKFVSKSEFNMKEIDLSGNKLRETPIIRGTMKTLANLNMSNQRWQWPLNASNAILSASFFNNMPSITGRVSLRNSSLSALCCKLLGNYHVALTSLDLSYNYLGEATLCELFYGIQTSPSTTSIEVILFPQFGHNPLTCRDLQTYAFRRVEFRDCRLAFYANNEYACTNRNFPVRHTTAMTTTTSLLPSSSSKISATAAQSAAMNSSTATKINASIAAKIVSVTEFVNDHFVAIIVVAFFILALVLSIFLFCYQRL